MFSKGKTQAKYILVGCALIGLLYLFHYFYTSGASLFTGPAPQPLEGGHQSNLNDVTNSTLGFGRIYVINLPSRTDRQDGLVLMAAVSGLEFHWIDGIVGENVLDKALPPPGSHNGIKSANVGSWRAHLDALKSVVEYNLGSALILEDDADWDTRIKSQMHDFALSSRALLQPLSSSPSSFADPSYQDPTRNPEMPEEIDFHRLPRTIPPATSAYGDDWDVLWLGHCGTEFPNTRIPEKAQLSMELPRGRVVHRDDTTVPENEYLGFLSKEDDPRESYPPHSRVVHHVMGSICSLAYAVSQRGARRLLYELGIKKFDAPYDIMLRDFCEGVQDRPRGTCLTLQPQLFNHHRPAGHSSFFSDISEHAEQIIDEPSTQMIRWSTRMNLLKLINGKIDYNDPYPDKSK